MRVAIALLLAVAGISMAGPLVRLSHADPLAIATWRLGISVAFVAVVLGATGRWRQWWRLDARGALLAAAAGAMLALHFWSWNASIRYTTIAASVVLVDTQPVVVALLSAVWLRERPTARQWLGIAVAVAGAAIVALVGVRAGVPHAPRATLGNLLALVGSLTAAIYYASGRRLRATLDLWPYVGAVYGSCFVTLLALSLVRHVALAPQPPRELAIFAGLALGPMLLGHTLINWTLRELPAFAANITVLGEPIGASIIAALLPGIREIPDTPTVAGGALILAGILLTLLRRPRRAIR